MDAELGDGALPDATVHDAAVLDSAALGDGAAADAAGASLLGPRFDFLTGRNPGLAVVADFNSDGRPDVAIVNFSLPRVSVHLNTTASGETSPSFSSKTDFVLDSNGDLAATAGDLNGDGLPDLVIANTDAASVSILLDTTTSGADTPTFAARIDLQAGESPASIQLADINRDGRLDIVVGDQGKHLVSVFLNTTVTGSALTFSPRYDFAVGYCNTSLVATDLNGDGAPDIAVGNSCEATSPNTLGVILSTTTAGATTPTFGGPLYLSAGAQPVFLLSSDVNLDWRPDLVSADLDGSTVSILVNETWLAATTPTFASAVDLSPAPRPISLASGDLDRDGRPDLVIATGTAGANAEIVVALNTTVPNSSVASFRPQPGLSEVGADSIALADVNGDGKLDVVVSNGGADTFSVYLAN